MIVFYSTHCPKCSILEKKLKQANIEYTENNDVNAMLAKGMTSAPSLEVDGKLMGFAESVEWIKSQEVN